jgi:hypothetical protein
MSAIPCIDLRRLITVFHFLAECDAAKATSLRASAFVILHASVKQRGARGLTG